MENIQERLITTIAKAIPLERQMVKADSTFDDLGIESLDLVNIVFEIEDEFDIEIPNDFNMADLNNVVDIKTAIETFLEKVPENVGQ